MLQKTLEMLQKIYNSDKQHIKSKKGNKCSAYIHRKTHLYLHLISKASVIYAKAISSAFARAILRCVYIQLSQSTKFIVGILVVRKVDHFPVSTLSF